MDALTLTLFLLGFVLLIVGAELLVRGAASLATMLGVSPLVIGLTVVAFGTSAPELAVSIRAAVAGQSDIAIGNVVGSNIANVLLILGISAAIVPLVVHRQLIRLDVPLMVVVSVLAWLMSLDGSIGRIDGVVLACGLASYVVFTIRQSRKETKLSAEEEAAALPTNTMEVSPASPASRKALAVVVQLLLVAAGLGLLLLGARWLVDGAVAVAKSLGVSELVIGLTVIAVGTSLPEVATSILAAIRGQRDIAVGNVVGSNIFNILSVLGLTAVVSPVGIPVAQSAITFDMPVMVAVALACLPIFFTGASIARWEGLLLLGYYIAYTAYLVLTATQHGAQSAFGVAIGFFALPLTAVTLVVLALRYWRGQVSERRVVEE